MALSLFWLLGACGERTPVQLSGETQGTVYHITVSELPPGVDESMLRRHVNRELADVDLWMSNWRNDSDVSRLNAAAPGQWVDVSPETVAVVEQSLDIWRLSDGAFNPAVGSLVKLWGFGTAAPITSVPADDAIERITRLADPQELEVRAQPPALRRKVSLELDLSALAPGYAVDRIADRFESLGIDSYMVELGGEVRLRGHNPKGRPWRIGIEQPGDSVGVAHAAIESTAAAISTSGDYRDYLELGGQRFSHTIDPATGRPVTHDLTSVTVVAQTAALADALSTAINVMGPERGLAFAREQELAVYFIVKSGDGFTDFHTPQFAALLVPQDGASDP